eukprot:2284970-Prymnesium_polylepis.1
MFEQAGCSAVHVLDAKDARDRLPSIQPVVDTLVLDWELGDMTGLDLLRQWKTDVRPRPAPRERALASAQRFKVLRSCAQLPENINVIFVSGDELEPDSKEECRKLGAHTFWLKPLKMQSLQVCSHGRLDPACVTTLPRNRRALLAWTAEVGRRAGGCWEHGREHHASTGARRCMNGRRPARGPAQRARHAPLGN